jgi:2-keto-4-pentenoate hydratase
VKTSRTSKCKTHGNSKGPVTEAGKARSAAAHIKTGEFTKQAIRERSQKLAEMMQLEDAMHVLKMTTATRTRGRKPTGYKRLTTIKDVFEFALDKDLNRPTTVGDQASSIEQFKASTNGNTCV